MTLISVQCPKCNHVFILKREVQSTPIEIPPELTKKSTVEPSTHSLKETTASSHPTKSFSPKHLKVKTIWFTLGAAIVLSFYFLGLPVFEAVASEKWTLLHYAAAEGKVEEVVKILGDKKNVDVLNSNGRTPLYEAAKRGRLKVVSLLIEKGANVNARGRKTGFYPLHIAAEQKHLDVVRLLLDSGAEIEAFNKYNQTPLFQVSWQVWHTDVEVARYLIKRGAKVNVKDNKGFTPLHMAVMNGYVNLIPLLLNSGANIDALDNNGTSPLFRAIHKKQYEAMKILLERGADVYAGKGDLNPISLAISNKEYDVVSMLEDFGARK